MPDSHRVTRKRVLIVDPSADSRDVLRTALERRGVEIYEARGAHQGLEVVRRVRPAVVVLDLEADADHDRTLHRAWATELAQKPAALVVLGQSPGTALPAEHHLVRKPYHYAPLIRKIEELIEHAATDRQ